MDTILRATDAAEFLSMVPVLTGCTPTDSLVLLPFHGARVYGAMRVDLPGDHIDPGEFADAALHVLAQVHDCDAVAIVIYTDLDATPTPDGLVLPHAVMVDALLCGAEEAGFRVVDALCVMPSGWGCHLDEQPVLHPPESIPASGDAVPLTGDQLSGTALPSADLAQRRRVGRALQDFEHVLERTRTGSPSPGADENPQALAAAVMLDDVPAFAEDLVAHERDLPVFACAALLWCLDRPALRDAILVQWASDETSGRAAFDAQLGHLSQGAQTPAHIGDVFLGRAGHPDPTRLSRALGAVRTAASRAPREVRAGTLASAAWLSWALGRSSHAAEYLRMAHDCDPEHRLTTLLQGLLTAAVLPEWLLNRAGRPT